MRTAKEIAIERFNNENPIAPWLQRNADGTITEAPPIIHKPGINPITGRPFPKAVRPKLPAAPTNRATKGAAAGSPADIGQSVADLGFMTAAEFAAAEFPQNYLIENILTEGQPHMSAGRSKTLKTTVGVLEMGISLASATPFLGVFAVPKSVRVGIVSAESGSATLQRNALTICKAKGVNFSDLELFITVKMPPLYEPASIAAIRAFIELNKITFLGFDPLYLGLLNVEGASQAGNLFAMGARLKELAGLIADTGVTLSLSHHCKKPNFFDSRQWQPPELEDMSMSGFQEFARQWSLYGRRSPYKHGSGFHELWLNVGGSAGHSGLYAIDVDEGIPISPRWEVTVKPAEEVHAEHAKQRAEERERKASAKQHAKAAGLVDDILAAAKECGDWTSRHKIREAAGKNSKSASDDLFADLVEDGRLETQVMTLRGKATPVYRISADSLDGQESAGLCPSTSG